MPAMATFDEIFGTHRGLGHGGALDDPHPSQKAHLHLDHLLSLVASGNIPAGLDELGADNRRVECSLLLSKLERGIAEALANKMKIEWAPGIDNFACVIGFAPDFLVRPAASEGLNQWILDRLHSGRTAGIASLDLVNFVTDHFAAGIIFATAKFSQQDHRIFSEDLREHLSHEDWCDVLSPYLTENPIRGRYNPEDIAMLQRAFHASLAKILDFRTGRTQDCAVSGRFRARFS